MVREISFDDFCKEFVIEGNERTDFEEHLEEVGVLEEDESTDGKMFDYDELEKEYGVFLDFDDDPSAYERLMK